MKLICSDFVPNGVTLFVAVRYVKLPEGKLDFFELFGNARAWFQYRRPNLVPRNPTGSTSAMMRRVHENIVRMSFSEAYFHLGIKVIRKANPIANLALVAGIARSVSWKAL
jgi:hypothetical protein